MEVRQICQNIDIPDVNEQYVPKHVVKKAVFDDHYQEMEKEVKKMKKLENIKNDDFRQDSLHGQIYRERHNGI